MKKWIALSLTLLFALSGLSALADVSQLVQEGTDLTHDELVELAKAEAGPFIVYGNTSRITTALEAFCAEYGFEGEGNNLKDSEIYIKLGAEMGGSAKGADMVMIQDGSALQSEALAFGYLVNYVPASVRESIGEQDQDPLVHQFINKVFIWNNVGDDAPVITNVWQLTEPQLKGNVIFKNPEGEQVNMNFLVMLTSEEWSGKLADAYKALYGQDIDLSGYQNAGYKWIAEFLSNCTFGNSDTTIAEDISQESAAGKVGLFVLSKLRSSSVYTDNLTVGQYLATETGTALTPFSGFMYPMYAMVCTNATRPYTAMLFIEYLMGTQGFEPWGSSIGSYSSNVTIPPLKSDLGLDVWKETLVIEDPDFITENLDEVFTFVLKYLQ